MEEKVRVFLGGTCNESTWRDRLIPLLKIAYFNPVVDDWDEAAQARELREREECDICLYVITPKKTGDYAIAEVVDDAHRRPSKTVFCFLETDEAKRFTQAQIKHLRQVGHLIERTGAAWIRHFDDLPWLLNNYPLSN